MLKFFTAIFLTLILASCVSSMPTNLSPDIEYQRDLLFSIQYWDGKKKEWSPKESHAGVAVIKRADSYRVEIFAPGKADLMVLSSCHREMKTPNPEKTGGWFSEKKYAFEFNPDQMLEYGKPCAISLSVYEKDKGRHGWAMLAIEQDDAKLSAQTRCNGLVKNNGGTSFCQAKESLIQLLIFDRPVETTFYGHCNIKVPADKKTWEYSMPRGKCILHFFDSKDENFEHVHYMFGYDQAVVRGAE